MGSARSDTAIALTGAFLLVAICFAMRQWPRVLPLLLSRDSGTIRIPSRSAQTETLVWQCSETIRAAFPTQSERRQRQAEDSEKERTARAAAALYSGSAVEDDEGDYEEEDEDDVEEQEDDSEDED